MSGRLLFRLAVAVCLGLLLILGGISLYWLRVVRSVVDGNPLFPPEMNAARHTKETYVVGNLGGVPVRIPGYYTEFVEYDGDPGFGEKRVGPVPVRTYESRLRSFLIVFRLTDMAGRSTPELWKDYLNYSDFNWEHYYDPVKSFTPWISVGVQSGEIYSGDGFLDRSVDAALRFDADRDGYPELRYRNYEKLPDLEYGLTVYAPPGVDPKTGKPYRRDTSASDLLVARDAKGKVTTYIVCKNRHFANLKFSSCAQNFSLEPQMGVEVEIRYSSYWLPQWRQIQSNATRLLLSFRYSPQEAPKEMQGAPRPVR